jgi:hypothetical protein
MVPIGSNGWVGASAMGGCVGRWVGGWVQCFIAVYQMNAKRGVLAQQKNLRFGLTFNARYLGAISRYLALLIQRIYRVMRALPVDPQCRIHLVNRDKRECVLEHGLVIFLVAAQIKTYSDFSYSKDS